MNIQDITDLNVHFLMVAREMAIQDRASACTQFGMSESDMDTLVNSTLADVVAMAANRKSLIRLAIPLRPVEEGSIDAIALQMTFIRGTHRASAGAS